MRVVAIVLAILGVAWLALGLLTLPGGDAWGYDFLAYRDAAVRLEETGTLYQDETVSGPYRPGPFGLYMYSPPPGVAILPLAWVPAQDGALVWHVLHILVAALACAVMPVGGITKVAVFGAAALSRAITVDIALGNVSTLLLLPLALAWRWLDRPLGAVAQAVAIAIRPTLGIILIWQLLRRRWRPVVWTVAAGVGIMALTLPFTGLGSYFDYVAVLRNLTGALGVTGNHDLGSTAQLLGADEPTATLVLFGGYAIAVAAILLSLRRDSEVGFMVAVGASMLLSPLLWGHYLALVALPAALLASRGQWWGLVLPFLTWVPLILQPAVVVLATVLPLLARSVPARQRGRTSDDLPHADAGDVSPGLPLGPASA